MSNYKIAVFFAVLWSLLYLPTPSYAGQQEDNDHEYLLDLSLEELMDVEITIASKEKEKLFETAAAVYVITAEDIRRSGYQSLPEVFRMVPGMQVARINANKWAVSSRGFNELHADKMLVMIDGRSIYNPRNGGVIWDSHDVMLEDVDRIEIIRGPGGTLWGANAVNGIINVITKNASDTQGTLVTGGGGETKEGFGAIRHGGKINDNTHYRVYSKYFNIDDGRQVNGQSASDAWDSLQSGFRIDSRPTDDDRWTLLGDIYSRDVGKVGTQWSPTPPISQAFTDRISINGGNILTRWDRVLSDGSNISLQMYYDRQVRNEKVFDETLDTFDTDFNHHFQLNDAHDITWGLGHRLYLHKCDGSFSVSLDDSYIKQNIYSGFVQDRITIVEDLLKLTIGSKIEYYDDIGFEFQPSARLLYTPDEKNTLWASVTRAVMTPSFFDRHADRTIYTFKAGPNVFAGKIYGNDDLEPQEVISYELGYRCKPMDNLTLDVTGFYNESDKLRTTQTAANLAKDGYTAIPLNFDNKMKGETYGFEVAAAWKPTDNWKLNAGYSFLQMQMHTLSSDISTDGATMEGQSPHNQFYLRSYLDLTDKLQLDCSLNYVDNLPTGDIEHYMRFDVRLGYRINGNMELSIVGQNLFDSGHIEFNDTAGGTVSEAPRSIFAKLTYRF